MKVLLIHPGTQHAPRLAEQLEKKGCLFRFWTGWARTGQSGSRRCVDLPPEKLRTRVWVEIFGALMQRAGFTKEAGWRMRNRLFQKLVPEKEILEADVVVGFDTASDVLAERCRRAGRRLVLDQTTPRRSFKAKIFRELGIPVPELSLHASVEDGERREQTGANKIVVASTFCRESFAEDSALQDKIAVLPYGVEPAFLSAGLGRNSSQAAGPTRFLYVGNLGRHKGIETLKQAWVKLESMGATLRVVGSGARNLQEELRGLGVEVAGQTDQEGVAKAMAAADVLVFPSYFEGFGRVILEAMAAGLPVITTRNTGGPDIIEEGKEGFLIPAKDAMALEGKMRFFISNAKAVQQMGRLAHLRALDFTWDAYGRRYRKEISG